MSWTVSLLFAYQIILFMFTLSQNKSLINKRGLNEQQDDSTYTLHHSFN